MEERKINLQPEWLNHLRSEFEQAYMHELSHFLRSEKASGKVIYPPGDEIFFALNSTFPDAVRVVILGQDPYHGPGQAHGLSFSVPQGVAIPPSLRNIYKELKADIGFEIPDHGNLQHWAEQGVLLLNSVLTVQAGQAASHQGRGWEKFTDAIVAAINRHCAPCVFMLWGKYAQRKGATIDAEKHLVLRSTHPSPLSAHAGFLGCRHFSQANAWLEAQGRGAIDWQL